MPVKTNLPMASTTIKVALSADDREYGVVACRELDVYKILISKWHRKNPFLSRSIQNGDDQSLAIMRRFRADIFGRGVLRELSVITLDDDGREEHLKWIHKTDDTEALVKLLSNPWMDNYAETLWRESEQVEDFRQVEILAKNSPTSSGGISAAATTSENT